MEELKLDVAVSREELTEPGKKQASAQVSPGAENDQGFAVCSHCPNLVERRRQNVNAVRIFSKLQLRRP